MPRVGIVTGLLEEAESFRPGEGAAKHDSPIYCRESERWAIACAGVGKVNAAVAATFLVLRRCDILLSFGVAGRVGSGREEIYWLTEAIQHDFGAWRGSRFVPYPAGTLPIGKVTLAPLVAMDDPGMELPCAIIITGDCFVEDQSRSDALTARHDAELVDMETGAIAQVAALFGIPWAGLRAVSDGADARGAIEFETNLGRTAILAAQAAERFVALMTSRSSEVARTGPTPTKPGPHKKRRLRSRKRRFFR